MTKQTLNEMTPAEQAKSLGLVYGGFGGWIDPKSRVVKARTIDGKLVKVEDEDEDNRVNLGRLTIFSFDGQILTKDKDEAPNFIGKYNTIIQTLIKKGGDIVFIIPMHQQSKVAEYLERLGIRAGPKLIALPPDDPNKHNEFVAKKIKEGYTKIHYFGFSEKNCHAVEALEATYNKLGVRVKTHLLTQMDKPTVTEAAIPRQYLPQIPKEEINNFREFVIGHGVTAKLEKVPVSSLHPIQSQVNREKVEHFKNDPKVGSIPLIVSSGGHILDGHHRWLAVKELDPNASMLCLVVDCPLKDLIELGHEFDPSFSRTVHESTTYGGIL